MKKKQDQTEYKKAYYARHIKPVPGEVRHNRRDSLLFQFERRTRKEVALVLGITHQAVGQIEHRALNKIRRRFAEMKRELTA